MGSNSSCLSGLSGLSPDLSPGLSSDLSSPSKMIDNKIDGMIFIPPKKIPKDEYKLLETDRLRVIEYKTVNNETISAIEIVFDEPTKYIVLSHGNATDIYQLAGCNYLHELAFNNKIGILMYDYIGYGISEGKMPSEQGCYDSIDASVNFLITERNIDKKKYLSCWYISWYWSYRRLCF